MQKVQYLLWRHGDEDPAVFSVALRTEVAAALDAAGARGVEVAVLDEAVAAGGAFAPAGHRRSTVEHPWEALLSVWVDSAIEHRRAPIDAAIGAGGRRFAAYLVTESEPLPVDAVHTAPVGERQPGYVQVAFLQRPQRLTHDAWLARWHDHHTPVAIATQSTFGYRQNEVIRPLTADAPPISAIVEEAFPIEALTDWYAFYDARRADGSPDDAALSANVDAMIASTSTFIDHETHLDVLPTSRFVIHRAGWPSS